MNKYVLNIDKQIDNESILIVKRSKFIAKVFNIQSKEEADQIIDDVKNKYTDAKHIVYAYMLKDGGKYSDDKEPQGTAGNPIYKMLEKENIINVMIVVIRYFGGVFLGTGLLTRTYLEVAKKVLNIYQKKEYIEYTNMNIFFEYKEEKIVKKLIEQTNSDILSTIRDSKVQMSINVPNNNVEIFLKYIK